MDSVLGQDHPNVELVLSDDGSTDGTVRILREYAERQPERVRLVGSERNTGIAGRLQPRARRPQRRLHRVARRRRRDAPGQAQPPGRVLEARPDAIGCCHDAEVFDSASGKTYGRFTEVYNGRRGVRDGGVELLLDPAYLMLPSTMMVRSSAVGGLRFDPRIRVSNDWLFDIELFRRGQWSASTTSSRAIGATSTTRRSRLSDVAGGRACGPGDRRCPLPGAPPTDPACAAPPRFRRGQPAAGAPAIAARRSGSSPPAGQRRPLGSFSVGIQLVSVEIGRRRLGVTVPR